MAKKKKASKSDLTPSVLPVTSLAARLDADDAVAATSGAERGPNLLDLRQLIEYVPPPLPAQASASVALAGEATRGVLSGFAAAASAMPPVAITYDVDRQTWLLLADYSCEYEGHALTAKAGFAFDLSSVPRPVWWLIAPNELSIAAPLFHDLLYEYRGRLPDESFVTPYRTYSRRETDDMFLGLMEREGVARWRRYAAYSAVRGAGGLWWAT